MIIFCQNTSSGSSGQDGGVGRDPSLPCTTKRRITTNLKSINNQNCQKIKLHGTPTNKELKKKSTRTTRPVRTCSEWEQGWLKAKLGLRADCGLPWLPGWEKLPVSHESLLKSALETSRWAALFPLWPLPHRQHRSAARRVAPPWWIPKALPPYNLSVVPRQRNMAQMKEQSKASERELSEEIVNLSDGDFEALAIKMLTDLIELSWKEKTSEGYPKWNKVKYSGDQQWQEGNQDSKQRFGTKGKNKHPSRTKWRNKNLKKWRVL